MSAMVESWMNELGKWKNRVEAQNNNNNNKPLMPKSNQLQTDHFKQPPKTHIPDSDDTDTSVLSESTICFLIDRFAPL
uniref:Uncharacterized protein n=1 Tax=Cucumis melo TaxID=3656 RepID=A0A9I9EJI2_CUCME